MKFNDLTGKKYGQLTVIERVITDDKKTTYWLCRCDCGKTTRVSAQHLKSGHTKSCGCLHSKAMKEMLTTHNMTNTKIYRVWHSIIERTENHTHKSYKHYGGRDIKVCNDWHNSFESFYKWAILNGYEDGLTIERIDTNGDYEPSNCR